MNKLNKLFAILFAVLGVTTLKAQTNIIANWDGGSSTGKPTEYGWKSSNSGRSWSNLNVNSGARMMTSYSGYKLENGSDYKYDANSALSSKILWIRYNSTSETYTYTFSGLEAGKVYTFSGLVGWHNNSNAPTFTIAVNGDKELAKVSKYVGKKQTLYPFSVDFMVPVDNQSENFTLTFKSNQGGDNMEALSALSIVESTDFANASESTPYDMTSWLKDAGFEDATGGAGSVNTPPGWTIKHSLSGWLDGTPNTTNPSEGSKCYNLWAGTVNSIDMYQAVTLPAGKYTVYADLRTDGVDKITNQGVYASVAGVITKSGTITNVAPTWNSKEGWNTLSATFNNASVGEVIIGISSTGNGGPSGWFQVDNVRLFYLGFDLTEANNALNSLITTAQGIVSANEASPISIANLISTIEAGQSVAQDKAAIEQASANLTTAINAANATIAACNEYRSMLALSESMYTNSTADDKSTFEAAINKAKSDFNAATSIDAISAIVTDLQNAQKAYCLVATPAEGHPFDMTFLVVNPWLDEGTKGWTFNTGAPNNGIATNQGGAITGNYFENWKWESYTGDIYQVLTGLPKGKYVLTAAAFRDQLIDGASDGDAVYVFANEAETLVDAASPAFYSVEVTTTTGELTFGVRSKVAKYRWMGIDNVTLQFVAGLDLSEFIAAYNAAKDAAIAARDNAEYSNVGGAEKAALLAAIAISPEETQESLNNATDELVAATNAFIAAKGDYDKLSAEIKVAQGLGMTDDQINAVISDKTGSQAYTALKVAEYNYIQETYTENATLGSWTEDFASDLDGEGYKAGGPKYLDDWQGNKTTRTTKQTVTLPAGDYALSVIARGQAGASGKLYYKIGDITTDVALIMKGNRGRGVGVNGVANFSEEGEYNCNGEGFGWEYRFITFHLDTETQVEIGASVTIQGQWASVYAPVLLTTETSVKALRLSEIATALGNVPTGKMNATVQAKLNDAVATAESVTSASTIDELNSVSTALTEAIAGAEASIADYSRLAKYIEMTKVFTDVNAYETNYNEGEYTADDVETVRQELNVLRFNAASEIFPNKIEVTGWEGSMGGKNTSGQHWDGTDTKYYDNNSWYGNAHSTMTSIELPKGTYVLKAALRSSANTTLTLTVLDQIVNVEGKGDTGYGVDTKGDANFSSDGSYANNNAGRGWEWEFVKFELEETTTVTLKVECNYNGVYGWASFSDITLWMDDETYMTVNGHAINEPLADAKSLVDTKPMGAAENDALKAAIALGENVSTAQELTKAIEELNTAVANANAWVAAYNEAKAPLVAALERFEADYNDAENGALNHMNKDRWATVIEKAQAAALAKDVTNSYDGFESAAGNLVAALDAATVSVGEYTALKTAIEESNAVYEGDDWGSKPFQKPESAKDALNTAKATAQTAYDVAEVDGDGVTAVIETLNTTINDVVLNAPEDGQRFYIKVATDGHDRKDNAWLMTLGTTGDNNPTGYGLNTDNKAKGYLAQAFIFTQVEGNLYNISIERPEGTVYLTYGSLNGSAAGWKNQQIQATTDAEKKGEFKIVPTGKNGILKIYNTVDNNYIDCQGGGAIYTDTNIENEEFAFELATESEVTLKISDAGWATLILPFNAEIPEELKAYTSVALGDESVELIQVSKGGIKANTPYLIKGTKGEYTFSGYGLADKDSYADEVKNGLFVGTYVDYTTEGGEYVLQKHKDGKVGFYVVGESFKPTVGAYRCYLKAPASEIKAFFIFDDDDVTGINGVDAEDIEIEAIYTINGTKVNNLQKGLNIVKMSNGKVKKVMVP